MDLGLFVRYLVMEWTNLETSLGSIARIRHFVRNTPSEEVTSPACPPEPWPDYGALEIKDFTASYSPTSEPVLRDINLSVRSGEKIGICGRTGSGKSSLVACLFGLLEQRQGVIELDSVETSTIPKALLRSQIIALPQEPFFLPGATVRENLIPRAQSTNPGRTKAADEQMVDVLTEVGLMEKLSELAQAHAPSNRNIRNALDLPLEDADAVLSQGQKQLFCLARAMLQEGQIVVIDEATSSVDAATDAHMQALLRKAFAGKTIIAIAHRLHTILDFDRVVVMERGRIVEVDAPSVLMKKEGSMFRALVEMQRRHETQD